MDYGSVITLWRYAIIHPIYTRDTFRGEFPLHVKPLELSTNLREIFAALLGPSPC